MSVPQPQGCPLLQHPVSSGPLALSRTRPPIIDLVQHNLFPPHETVILQYLLKDITKESLNPEATDGYLWFLPNLCANAPEDSALLAVTSAIALGTLGGYLRRPEYLIKARSQYNRALQRTNAAIQDPVLARKDETLMTVLLFSLFEVNFVQGYTGTGGLVCFCALYNNK